jgi:hypothetical protein
MDYRSEDQVNTDLKERLFAGATITSCLFSFISCLSLVIVVPTISENAISISEKMYMGSKHCNVSQQFIQQIYNTGSLFVELNKAGLPFSVRSTLSLYTCLTF